MNTPHLIGFPGLGIGPFEINPIAVKIFGREIAWYGIIITLSFIIGFFYSIWRGKKEGIKPDDMIDIAFSIPVAIIGARLYYVVFEMENYHTFYDVIATWEGGLAVYGGIIFGVATAFFISRYKKISFLNVMDSVSPAIILGQAIGRWGNFTNAEAYGGLTELPWRMSIQGVNSGAVLLVHPTFLYESVWNLIGFVILSLLFKKKKFNGEIFLMYISWYGFGRMLIEGLRTDSLYLGPVRISQILGGVCFVFGILLIIVLFIRQKNHALANGEYVSILTSESDTPVLEEKTIPAEISEQKPEIENTGNSATINKEESLEEEK